MLILSAPQIFRVRLETYVHWIRTYTYPKYKVSELDMTAASTLMRWTIGESRGENAVLVCVLVSAHSGRIWNNGMWAPSLLESLSSTASIPADVVLYCSPRIVLHTTRHGLSAAPPGRIRDSVLKSCRARWTPSIDPGQRLRTSSTHPTFSAGRVHVL